MTGRTDGPPVDVSATLTASSSDDVLNPYLGGREERKNAKK